MQTKQASKQYPSPMLAIFLPSSFSTTAAATTCMGAGGSWLAQTTYALQQGPAARHRQPPLAGVYSSAAGQLSSLLHLHRWHSRVGRQHNDQGLAALSRPLTSPYFSSGAAKDTASVTPGCASSAPSTCRRWMQVSPCVNRLVPITIVRSRSGSQLSTGAALAARRARAVWAAPVPHQAKPTNNNRKQKPWLARSSGACLDGADLLAAAVDQLLDAPCSKWTRLQLVQCLKGQARQNAKAGARAVLQVDRRKPGPATNAAFKQPVPLSAAVPCCRSGLPVRVR